MASRTQIRLEQLTGSMAAPASLGSKVALASLPAGHLGDVLDEMGQAIARIHGEKDFTNKDAGVFTHAQSVFEGELRATSNAYMSGSAAIAGAADLKSTLDVAAAASFAATLAVAGDADLNAALDVQGNVNLQAELAAAGAITFSAASGASAASDPDVGISGHVAIAKDAKVVGAFEVDGGATLNSAKIEDLSDGHIVLVGLNGELIENSNVTYTAQGGISAEASEFSSLQVSDLTSGRVTLAGADGELEDSANLTFDGSAFSVTGTAAISSNLSAGARLDVAGASDFKGAMLASGSAEFKAAVEIEGAADLQSTLAVAAAATFASSIEVTGAADLNSSLDVAEEVSLAASGKLTDIRGTLSVDEAATFDSNVTISGNLTVAGSTTTVNTEEVTIADHNIILDSNNTLAAVIDGSGITIEGGTGDDLTFQWHASNQEMQLKLGSNFADLEIKDLDAAGIVLSADLSAVNGTFSSEMSSATADISGDASVGGELSVTGAASAASAAIVGAVTAASAAITNAMTAGSADIAGTLEAAVIKIDGDAAQRLYIVDTDGSMKDEAKLVFDQTKLAVTGDEEVSGYLRAAKIEIDSASDYIDIDNGFKLNSQHGAFKFMQAGGEFGKIAQDAGNMKFISEDLVFAYDDGVNPPAEVARIDGSESALLMAGQHEIRFNDAQEAIYSDGDKLNLKSGNQNYKLPSSGVNANYVLQTDASGVLAWVAADSAASATARKYVSAPLAAAISAGSDHSEADYAELSTKANKQIDVYLNGQLLVGSKYEVAGTYTISAVNDYALNTTDSAMRFAFDLEIDDRIVVIGR